MQWVIVGGWIVYVCTVPTFLTRRPGAFSSFLGSGGAYLDLHVENERETRWEWGSFGGSTSDTRTRSSCASTFVLIFCLFAEQMGKEGQSKGLKIETDERRTGNTLMEWEPQKKKKKPKFRHRNRAQRTRLRVLPSRTSACSYIDENFSSGVKFSSWVHKRRLECCLIWHQIPRWRWSPGSPLLVRLWTTKVSHAAGYCQERDDSWWS